MLAASAHLTDRDRDLVRLVAVHRVLTTDQLAALGFGNITTARHRLSALVRLGMVRRFRPHPPTGSAPWHYVLGPVGATMLGVEDREEKRWAPHVRVERQLALERSPRLTHMSGRNWFFVALARDAREHGGELREWLNEADTAARYEDAPIRHDDRARLPHPDGAGTWAEDGRVVSFLLEYDTGTEHLPVLTGKLDGYQVLAAGLAWHGQVCPVLLFCFGSPRREQAARRHPGGRRPADRDHGARPAHHQPGRAGLAAAARPHGRPGAADRPGPGVARPMAELPGAAGTRTPRGRRARAGAALRRRGRRRARRVRHPGPEEGVWAVVVTAAADLARPARRAHHTAGAMGDKPASDHTTRQSRSPAQPDEQQDLVSWATELAASLPPLTESQATAVGRVATQLDARINHQQAA